MRGDFPRAAKLCLSLELWVVWGLFLKAPGSGAVDRMAIRGCIGFDF